MDLLTSEQTNMIATLARDAIACHKKLAEETGADEFWKRTMIKNIFAFHEGICSILRDIARSRQDGNWNLDEGERDVLGDLEFQIKDNGKITSRRRKDRTLNLIAFTIRLLLKHSGVPDENIKKNVFGVQAWNDLCESMKVRDRLTHPKTVECLHVTGTELEKCRSSMAWMYSCITMASRADLMQAGIPNDQVEEVEKRILAALPDVPLEV